MFLVFWFPGVRTPGLHEPALFKFGAGHGILPQLVAVTVEPPANEFDRAAAVGLIPVDPENFTHEANPSAATKLGKRLEFPGFVDMVTVQMLAGYVAPATGHAAHTLFEFIESGDILPPVATNLTRGLARDGGFVFLTHIVTNFWFLGAAFLPPVFLFYGGAKWAGIFPQPISLVATPV